MGYDVEFKRKVFKYNEDDWTKYICVAYIGDSNCFNEDGSMVKNWRLIGIGHKYEVIQKICKYAGSTEGGMLKYRNGNTKPENYIKNWRKAIKEAKPLSELRGNLKLYLKESDELDKYDKERIESLRKSDNFLTGSNWYSDEYIGIKFNNNPDEIDKFNCLLKSGRVRGVEIY